jgi:hypothetical protein
VAGEELGFRKFLSPEILGVHSAARRGGVFLGVSTSMR